MKASTLLPVFALLPLAAAFPTQQQIAFGSLARNLINQITNAAEHLVHDAVGKALLKDQHPWSAQGKHFIKQNGLTYELFSHPEFSDYKLRITSSNLCDASVKQYSGYLDIQDDKHLFFWFFESRSSPSKAPLVLWLNGGPGCSSSTGLLAELGPCRVFKDGKDVKTNPHSWNNHANIIFLDQPVNVGYSYGRTVNNSPVAGKDVHAFLQLFLNRFEEYANLPFHVAAESYGGTYGPNIVKVISEQNKQLALVPTPGVTHINLKSLILGNGLTDPYIQMGAVADWVCDGPYPLYNDTNGPECTSLRSKIPTCQRLIKSCYDYNSKFTCVPAGLYCSTQLFGPLMETGRNPYDVRLPCDREKDGDMCYSQIAWIDTWMNAPSTKAALGVNPDIEFTACNGKVNRDFALQGDGTHNPAALLPELIDDGMRLLVYAGTADMMCNYIGNERWVEALETTFSAEFRVAKQRPWVTMDSGKVAGMVRSAGGNGFTAGNVTYVAVYEAGHMVPYDQPEAALDMITRWLMDIPLTL